MGISWGKPLRLTLALRRTPEKNAEKGSTGRDRLRHRAGGGADRISAPARPYGEFLDAAVSADLIGAIRDCRRAVLLQRANLLPAWASLDWLVAHKARGLVAIVMAGPLGAD